jgi:hypothetical protein
MMLQYSELAVDLERIRRFLVGNSQLHQTSDQRRFSYIACISALYSTFENFVERIAFSFSEKLLTGPTTLPAEQMRALRRRYVRNASALLNQSLGVGRYRDVTELDVARSLASCLDESDAAIDLRLELISLHGSNLRWDSLTELFHWAVPDLLNRVRKSDSIEGWMSGLPNMSEETQLTVLKSELDDLVERRNEVAHRALPDEILSYENLLAKVDYIEAVSLGLVASLAGLLLEAVIKNGESVPIGSPAESYQKNRVVVIQSLESAISEGDLVLAPGRRSTRWGKIVEIRLDDERVSQGPIGAEAGLLLDFELRKGGKLHVWREPDYDIASTPDGIFGARGPLRSK